MKLKIVHFIRNIISVFFYLLPVKNNKIVFINFNGKGFGCNPKYIAQEIIHQKLDFQLVWLVSNINENMPSEIKKARYGRIAGLYELATARVIITNVKNELYLIKKKNQYIIQTWHASYGSKLVERDAEDKLSTNYLRDSKKNSKQTNLFLSNSKKLSELYRNAFWCECEILECGFPRNDVLFIQNTKKEKLHIKKMLNISYDAKVVLYAPTFRDDGSVDAYSIDYKGILNILGDDWVMLIRMHPNATNCSKLFHYNDRVINATYYPDMQEILIASDILITDYSSTVFDFAVMNKPSYIFATDIERYLKVRGLKKDFFHIPYPICKTNEELIELLRLYTPESGNKEAKEFIEMFGGVDKGDASKQVVEHICSIVKKR